LQFLQLPLELAAFPGGLWVDRELHRSSPVPHFSGRCVRKDSSSGFTLIEVLVALLSVSVLVAGAAALLSTASMAMRSARNSTTAMLLAVQKVEQFGAVPTTLVSGTAQDYFAADATAVPPTAAFFTRRWTVTPGWASSVSTSVLVEVFVTGVGRVADVEAAVGGGGASQS
jgi:prepilin-type N-terminal cleavage/methylation domain-containing protein